MKFKSFITKEIDVKTTDNYEKFYAMNLGQPTCRQDAIILSNWFEQVMWHIQEAQAISEDQKSMKLKQKKLCINLAMKEACRQVSV